MTRRKTDTHNNPIKASRAPSKSTKTPHDTTQVAPAYSLAKLTAPTLPTVIERRHLFDYFADCRARGVKVIWIQGPPGAGKTTLAASYLRAHNLSPLWYQLDAGDADPAAWFHYLTLGIHAADSDSQQPLPVFEVANMANLPGFTRRFFEQMFLRLSPPSAVVFDNYHDLPNDNPVDGLMREAFRMIPSGKLCIVTSRQAPPQAFATLLAEQTMVECSGDLLPLTRQETHDLLQLHHVEEPPTAIDALAQDLYETTKGWLAGIILLGTKARMSSSVPSTTPRLTAHLASDDPVLFDYFSQEGLVHQPSAVRLLLLKTAMLPAFTVAMAQQLSGLAEAGYELKNLVRARYFVENRSGSQTVFQYHPLFKEFLCGQAAKEFGTAAWSELQTQAADLLVAEGWIEEAIQVLLKAGHLHTLGPLLLQKAPDLLGQGRFQTLTEWLNPLPSEVFEQEPGLLYWQGMSRLLLKPAESLEAFRAAFAAFQHQQDVEGMLLAASGIVQAIEHTWTEFDRLDPWLTEIDTLWEQHGASMSPDVQATVTIAMVHGLFWRLPSPGLMRKWIDRTEAFLPQFDRLNELPLIILYVLFCARWFGLIPQGLSMMRVATQRLNHIVLSPSTQVLWTTTQVVAHGMSGDFQEAKQHVHRGLELSEHHGFTIYTGFLINVGLASAMNNQDRELGETLVAKGWERVSHMGPVFEAAFSSYNAWLCGLRHEWEKAATFAQQAPPLARKTKSSYAEGFMAFGVALIAMASGRFHDAQDSLQEAETLATQMGTTTLQLSCHLLRTYEALKTSSREDTIARLQQGLSLGTQHWITYTTEPSLPIVLAPCCALALEEGIEPEFVRQLIRVKRLTLDSTATETTDWPWPIRIQTLGRFVVTIEERPLTFKKKTPQMPLRLLKALISFGGQDVPLHELRDLLWPDADGDAAYRSLLSALTRLRKLLGREDVLIVQGSELSLNRHLCWVDCLAFPYLAQAAEEARNNGQSDRAHQLAIRADQMYQGFFLNNDDFIPQMKIQRERLAERHTNMKTTFSM